MWGMWEIFSVGYGFADRGYTSERGHTCEHRRRSGADVA